MERVQAVRRSRQDVAGAGHPRNPGRPIMAATHATEVHRQRLFSGICLALIPTGASFALVSNILVQLKQEFILTNYQVGLIGGAALWGMAISLLVLGPLLGNALKRGEV